jgi:hypothetical protein
VQTIHLAKFAKHSAAVALLLLLIPLAAMQFSSEVVWGLGDFLAAAVLLFAAAMAHRVGASYVRTRTQRLAVGMVVLAALAAVWAELAVGLFT